MAKLSNIIERDRSLWMIIKFVFKASIKGSKSYSILRYGAAALSSVFMFVEFGALGMVINEFSTRGIHGARMNTIIFAFSLIVVSTLIPVILSSLRQFFSDSQSNDMQRYLQKLIFTKMEAIDIGTIEQPEFQNLLDVANSRGWSAVFNIIAIISNSLGNIIALVLATISLIVISPMVLVVIIISVLPTYLLERKNAERTAELWKRTSETRRIWQSKSGPVYGKNSLVELKNFTLVGVFLKGWTDLIGNFHEEAKSLNKQNTSNEIFTALLVTVGYGIGFFLIIHKVYLGTLLIGSLVYTFAVISRFQSALQSLFENFGRIAEHQKNVSSLLDVLEMQPLIISGRKMILPEEFKTLEIKNVSFAYPGSDRKVMNNLSLKIERGQNFAVVGLNGAGKTTLLKIITRVYDPVEGEVLVNGVNLKEYDLECWKKCLGILMQDYSTYSEENIAQNIMLGDIGKKDMDLVKISAQESTAHDYIMDLPQGYDQLVGTEFRGGVELSKGQKQKLVLSRVFYRNAPIMILDEPTAAVDALSEDQIFKTLRTSHQDQTRIIISHKFSNVRDADKIILIEHGKIIEQGTHDELMAIGTGKYRELFDLQAEGYKTKPKKKVKKSSENVIV